MSEEHRNKQTANSEKYSLSCVHSVIQILQFQFVFAISNLFIYLFISNIYTG